MTHMFPPGPYQGLPTCSPMLPPCLCPGTPSLIHLLSCNKGGLLDKGSLLRHLQGLPWSQDYVRIYQMGLCSVLGVLASLTSSAPTSDHSYPLVTLASVPLLWPIQVQWHTFLPPMICTSYFLINSENLLAWLSSLVWYDNCYSFKTCLSNHVPEDAYPQVIYVSLLCSHSILNLLSLQPLSCYIDIIYIFVIPLATCWVLIISLALHEALYMH